MNYRNKFFKPGSMQSLRNEASTMLCMEMNG